MSKPPLLFIIRTRHLGADNRRIYLTHAYDAQAARKNFTDQYDASDFSTIEVDEVKWQYAEGDIYRV